MSCKLCNQHLVIGENYCMTSRNFTCNFCLRVFESATDLAQYRGICEASHIFRLHHSLNCPHCQIRLFSLSIPCDNTDDNGTLAPISEDELYRLFGITKFEPANL